MNNIKIVIPARYGSSRLQGKPLLEIIGKPIFWHVYQRCIESGFKRKDIYLATDDERIIIKANELDVNVVKTSEAHESGTDRINEVALMMSWPNDYIVINVQGDEPLIPAKLINDLSQFAINNPKFSICTAVTKIALYENFINPNIVKAIIGDRNQALYFTRAASPFNRDNNKEFALAYRHIGIYAYCVSALKEFCSYPESSLESYEKLEQLRALSHGMTFGVLKYTGEIPHGIDTQDDLELIKKIMEI